MRVNFDLNSTTPFSGSYQTLPAGSYLVEIDRQEEKTYANASGTRLVMSYTVLDGPYKGATILDSLNLNHPSDAARQMAQRRLKAIVDAVGLPTIMDTVELNKKPFVVRLEVTKDNQGNERNNVAEYSKATATAPIGTPSAVPAAPTTAPTYQQNGPFWG